MKIVVVLILCIFAILFLAIGGLILNARRVDEKLKERHRLWSAQCHLEQKRLLLLEKQKEHKRASLRERRKLR